ncbi:MULTISPECIES: aldolase/citrate lyase family protein [Amycolatopsis]|uniref:Aldolase/citrate lyase family protein n=1 Tax=Amycolatopsis thermalba TaxID=944492 RepID=A0ABY4NNB5_9PSEU|nr:MULTISPECIES: aldolase/citrate lyase family protein [Amycolatopsis]UQS22095.1 aldolase/citrate lyase family protein [Amycolatopsis thermalba]
MPFHESVIDARTMLFVPGDRPDRFSRAVDCDPDLVVLDLEDAVVPADKRRARENVRAWRNSGGSGIVRINDDTTDWWQRDLSMLAGRVCGASCRRSPAPNRCGRWST